MAYSSEAKRANEQSKPREVGVDRTKKVAQGSDHVFLKQALNVMRISAWEALPQTLV